MEAHRAVLADGWRLLVGQLLFRKNLLKSLMGAQMELPDAAWRAMNWSWTGFFAVMGVLNLWVAYNFDTDTWVNFKLFGGLGLMAVFVLGKALYLGRYLKDDRRTRSAMSMPRSPVDGRWPCSSAWQKSSCPPAGGAGRKCRAHRPCRAPTARVSAPISGCGLLHLCLPEKPRGAASPCV
jgi:hypothetical protein